MRDKLVQRCALDVPDGAKQEETLGQCEESDAGREQAINKPQMFVSSSLSSAR